MLKRIIIYRSSVSLQHHISVKSKSVCSRQYCDERFNTEEFKHWFDWKWNNYIVSICHGMSLDWSLKI